MRHQGSAAWLELGYTAPALEELNAAASAARALDRRAVQERKDERAAVPLRRMDAKKWWRLAHQAADGIIRCSESGRIEELQP